MTRLYFNEVATRDGFQNECNFIPTETKVELIDELSRCGYAKIEVSSFTSPKAIPMLRDADEVMRLIKRVAGVDYTVLVPNMRGAERAMAVRADELNLVMSVSETHNLSNLRMPRASSFSVLSEVIREVDGKTPINVSLSCCFGCPMEGAVAQDDVIAYAKRFAAQGVRGITVCDTTGMAHPAQVSRMVEAFSREVAAAYPALQLTLHFHNTRGMGLANVYAAVLGGVSRFDASLGGLGGCPYAPGASGNIASEEAIHMLQASGYDTGIDIDRLMKVARQLPHIVSHEVPSQLVKSGLISDLHPVPQYVRELMQQNTGTAG